MNPNAMTTTTRPPFTYGDLMSRDNVTRKTLQMEVRRGRLKKLKIGRAVRFLAEDVARYEGRLDVIESSPAPAAPEPVVEQPEAASAPTSVMMPPLPTTECGASPLATASPGVVELAAGSLGPARPEAAIQRARGDLDPDKIAELRERFRRRQQADVEGANRLNGPC